MLFGMEDLVFANWHHLANQTCHGINDALYSHTGLCACACFSSVYHYQMKMHIFSYKSLGETEPTFSVTLHGTNNDSQPLSLEM